MGKATHPGPRIAPVRRTGAPVTLGHVTQQQWGRPGTQQPWQQTGGQQPWGPPPAGWAQPGAPRAVQGYPPVAPPLGYGPPGGYQPIPQPPRQGSPIKLVLLGLVAVIAVGFFFVSLMNFLNGEEVVGPQPGQTEVPQPGQTSAPPVGVPEPDLDPPDLPIPKTYEEAEQWLVNNALYAQSVEVPTNCTLGRINPVGADPKELEDHLNNLTGCLMMVWQAPMERAGFVMPRPPVTVYSSKITTACGALETGNAVYCSGDQRVYYATDLHEVFRRTPDIPSIAFMADIVIGHEFGHAQQARSGILISSAAFEQQADKAEALWFSRRAEQQADCWSGIFLNAVAQASRMTDEEQLALRRVAHAIGDDILTGRPDFEGDHGLGANRERWFVAGQGTNQAGVCNTWVAPRDQVR